MDQFARSLLGLTSSSLLFLFTLHVCFNHLLTNHLSAYRCSIDSQRHSNDNTLSKSPKSEQSPISAISAGSPRRYHPLSGGIL